MTPQRIQLKRTKGWRKPENTVVVTRPGKWGNPFVVGRYYRMPAGECQTMEMVYTKALIPEAAAGHTLITDAAMAVDWFKRLRTERSPMDLSELRGKNLACWCRLDQPCHADVLLSLANSPTAKQTDGNHD
jgi:hypothetical protein